ncbi:hypothetical protein AALO_G00047490 [Alosa alosa]|uniref:Uncharacterized protein n=1 Tax=Alosa alosa TaxID=278164 RepID=A0AAV6H3P9_9TELE|nr:hypothetical protein AALO_G00047490 [Alosa alosa]
MNQTKVCKHTLLEAVSKRFNAVQTEPLYAIATMVDARYKDRYFDPDKEEARNMMLKVVDEMASVGNDQREDAAGASADDPGQEDQDPPPKRARTGSLQDMYQEILTENDVAKQATTGETASQDHAYLGEATILKTACPFKYWSFTCPSCTQVPHCALYQRRQRAAVQRRLPCHRRKEKSHTLQQC